MDVHQDTNREDAVKRFISYPFETDEAFQQGVAGIMSSTSLANKTETEKQAILLSSKVFYFNRITGLDLTVDDVRNRNEQEVNVAVVGTPVLPEGTNSPPPIDEPRVLSFAELKTLIEQGKTDQIPNNRVIPDEVSQEKPSESKAAIRKKPWEQANQDVIQEVSTV